MPKFGNGHGNVSEMKDLLQSEEYRLSSQSSQNQQKWPKLGPKIPLL